MPRRLVLSVALLAAAITSSPRGAPPRQGESAPVLLVDDFEDGDRTSALSRSWELVGSAGSTSSEPWEGNPIRVPGAGRRLELQFTLRDAGDSGAAWLGVVTEIPERALRAAPPLDGLVFAHSGSPGVEHYLQVWTSDVEDGAHFACRLPPSAVPAAARIRWEDLSQPPWGRRVARLDPTRITTLVWAATGSAESIGCLTLDSVAFTAASSTALRLDLPRRAAPRPEPPDGLAAPEAAPVENVLAKPRRVSGAGADVRLGELEGVPSVEVLLDGRGPYSLVLDSGTSLPVVSARVARELGLRPRGRGRVLGSHAESSELLDVVGLESLQLGDVTLHGLDAAVVDFPSAVGLSRVDGLLGLGALSEFLVTIDGPRGALTLEKGALDRAAADVVELEEFMGVPAVSLDVGATSLRCALDTGFAGWISLADADAERLSFETRPRPVAWAWTVDGVMRRAHEGRLAGEVRLGRHVLKAPVVDLGARHCLLGADLLERFVVTLDQRSKLARFKRRGGGRLTGQGARGRGLLLEHRCGRVVVGDVLPGSPAAKAGLVAGETVLALAGVPSERLTPENLRWLDRAPGTLHLTVERAGKRETIAVTTAVLVP